MLTRQVYGYLSLGSTEGSGMWCLGELLSSKIPHCSSFSNSNQTHFLTDETLTGVWLHDALAFPTEIQKFWEYSNLFFVTCRIVLPTSGCS